jgi:hypothetical protein
MGIFLITEALDLSGNGRMAVFSVDVCTRRHSIGSEEAGFWHKVGTTVFEAFKESF